MEHTWQSNHHPKLEVSNLDSGDVAICTATTKPGEVDLEINDDRVAFVAPLCSRSDLEWLLRGLHLHPRIRHVVIHGDDPMAAGETLLQLWEEGLDPDGRLPGSRGRLSPEIEAGAIDSLRTRVRVSDLRGKSSDEIARFVTRLPEPEAGNGAEPLALSNPEIPERKAFLSRKSSFPIFSCDVADSWLQLLNLALRIGTDKEASNGERFAEALNAIVTIETPVLEDGEQATPDDFADYLDFGREDFERRYLPHYKKCLNERGGSDQLEVVCDRLRKSHDTRSGTMVFLDPGDVCDSRLTANLISATFTVVDERLFGSFVLRGSDLYTEWPLEAMALVHLQRDAAERLGLEAGTATFVIHSAYLYERDWDRSLRLLQESFKRPLPLHVDPSGVFLFGNDGGKARAMLLNHDASRIQWEEAFSDPEDLSWYIVDVMPWLLPQHIRYVGQECAALMRAMQEKECYLQG